MSKKLRPFVAIALLCTGVLVLASAPALASLATFNPPSVSCVSSGENEITIKICGDALTGAPAGVTVQWMDKLLYDQVGWLDSESPGLCALSLSGQPSLNGNSSSRWELQPGDPANCQEITIGDINFDETGVSGSGCGLDALECGHDYVLRVFAHAGKSTVANYGRSDWSPTFTCSTLPCPGNDCTLTQGFWKNHGPTGCVSGNNTDVWPVSSLTLGSPGYTYTDVQLCSILNTPSGGNGLISLAHQLIAAELNIAQGADACSGVSSAIASANTLIGTKVVPPVGGGSLSSSSTSSLTHTLDQFNNGLLGVDHCSGTVVHTNIISLGGLRIRYR